MNQGKSIFPQFMDFLPKHKFRQCVNRYGGNSRVLSFTCFNQFMSMAFPGPVHRGCLLHELCLWLSVIKNLFVSFSLLNIFFVLYGVKISEHLPLDREYKRRLRSEKKRQAILKAQNAKRLKDETKRRKSSFLKKVAGSIPKPSVIESKKTPNPSRNTDRLSPLLYYFSPPGMRLAKIHNEFDRHHELSITDRLPWKHILLSQITESTGFGDLENYIETGERTGTAAKLQTLLQLESDGKINLHQSEPFGEIVINPASHVRPELMELTVVYQSGESFQIDWTELNNDQKYKIIAGIKDNKILCR